MIIHDIERLGNSFHRIVLDALTIYLNGHNPTPGKLEYFLQFYLIFFSGMKFYFRDPFRASKTFCIENLFVIASNKMVSEHGLRLANYFKFVFV